MPRRDPVATAANDIVNTAQILLRHYQVLDTVEDGGLAPDGYRSNSLGGGAPTNEIDDDGTPIPQRSDPTFRAVEQRENAATNPHRAARREIERVMFETRRMLDAALSRAAQLERPKKLDPATNDKMWCTNHARHGMTSEPVRSDAPGTGLCRWCADWKADAEYRHLARFEIDDTPNPDHDPTWPLLPPGNVLERKARGDSITNRVLRECGLGPRAQRQQRLSKKQQKRARRGART